jgi:hypothetical protein
MTDQNTYNRQLIEEFRADRGKSGGPMEGRPLLLICSPDSPVYRCHFSVQLPYFRIRRNTAPASTPIITNGMSMVAIALPLLRRCTAMMT